MRRFWTKSAVALMFVVVGTGLCPRAADACGPQDRKRVPGTPVATPPAQTAPPARPVAQSPNTVEVVATGHGTTKDAARKDALVEAVMRVVGAVVESQAKVENDAVISSKIIAHSDGFVEKYEPVGEPKVGADGQTSYTIRAWVRTSRLTEALTANSVAIKEGVDLRSLQGQSETIQTRDRSATEVVKAAFEGFPSRFWTAEPLEPKRISGDSETTIIEVPVRVRIDAKAWREWATGLPKLLDKLAEAKGTGSWNFSKSPWKSLLARMPSNGGSGPGGPGLGSPKVPVDDPDGGSPSAKDGVLVDGFYAGRRFLPNSERGKGYWVRWDRYHGYDPLGVGGPEWAVHRRFLGVMNSLSGTLRWWQLPEDAWGALFPHAGLIPTLNVSLVDGAGDNIGTSVEAWTESVGGTRPGESATETVASRDGLGRARLSFGQGYPWWIKFDCALGRADSGFDIRNTLASAESTGVILFPGTMLAIERDQLLAVSESAIVPFRFEVPAEAANYTRASVRCEIVDAGTPTGAASSDK